MRIPIPRTTCDVIGLNGHRLFWHLQLEQEKEIFHGHESGKQAREKMQNEHLRLTRKLTTYPYTYRALSIEKVLIHNPYNFCWNFFPWVGA